MHRLRLRCNARVQHVHLSDNVSPQGNFNAYARFRLRPEDQALAGLTPHLNETYSREEFDAFQAGCAARGVTVSGQQSPLCPSREQI